MPAISPAAPAPIIRTVRALLWLFFIDCRFLHLFIDVVLIPDALQLGIGLADLILLFQADRHSQGVEHAQRRYQTESVRAMTSAPFSRAYFAAFRVRWE